MESRTALDPELADEVRRRVFSEPGFMRLTQVSRQGGRTLRASLRPVRVHDANAWQFEQVADGRTTVRNLDAQESRLALDRILGQTGPRELHVTAASGDLHVRITRKGRPLVSRSKPLARTVDPALPHDRVKRQPLQAFESSALLRVIGLADTDGRLRPSMRGKYDQVNEFLRELAAVLPEDDTPLEIVDCGCGRAYLTLSAAAYLTEAFGRDVRVRGIDRNAELIAAANAMAADLGLSDRATFIASDLAAAELDPKPNLLLSLHACDTATDEAIAAGVEWGCERMLVSPCCQHDLQGRLAGGGAMRALLRHGILRERLADLLTDTFRSQILRILGYRVRVVEFVSAEATGRNLMLRAESGVRPGQLEAVEEYLELRALWKVTPALETRLRARLEPWVPAATWPSPPASPEPSPTRPARP